MSKAGLVKLLRGVSIFSNLNEKSLFKLSELLLERHYPKDTLVFNQDDSGDSMFVIFQGRVKVVLYGESGKEITLTFFNQGDFFGEMSLLDDMPRSANVLTMDESTLLILKRESFKKHLVENPTTAVSILAELSKRLRKADEIIGNLALLDVYGRVARFLVDLGKEYGNQTEEGTVISRRPNQQDIASMVGATRETVSRVLNELQKRSLITIDGKRIVLRPSFYSDLK